MSELQELKLSFRGLSDEEDEEGVADGGDMDLEEMEEEEDDDFKEEAGL